MPTSGVRIAATPTAASHPSRTAPQEVPEGRMVTSRAMWCPPYTRCHHRACKRGARWLDRRCAAPGTAGEGLGEVRLLPRQVELGPAEVAVRGCLPVDRPAHAEAFDDLLRAEVEVLVDESPDDLVVDGPGAERLDVQRHRLRDADDVRDLDLAARREMGGDDVLRDVARGVRARAVDLRRVLAAERAAAVRCVAAIRVDDDLAPGEAGVAHRPADDELAGAVDDVARVRVDQVRRDRGADDGVLHVAAKALDVDVLVVLRRDDDRVDAPRLPLVVL